MCIFSLSLRLKHLLQTSHLWGLSPEANRRASTHHEFLHHKDVVAIIKKKKKVHIEHLTELELAFKSWTLGFSSHPISQELFYAILF